MPTYMRKEKKSHINDLSFHTKKPGKEKQIKCRLRKIKKIIKIRVKTMK